jgi:murein DD-endopeptidase MepM/ murein hydrolase activator NlpD
MSRTARHRRPGRAGRLALATASCVATALLVSAGVPAYASAGRTYSGGERSGQARQQDGGLAELAARAEEEAASLARAWLLPLAPGYRLTAGFGECSSLWAHCHTGLDLAAPSGTPVRAVAAGTITDVGWAGAYGNRTVETLGDGTEIWYCHQETIGVRLGDDVAAGQEIGAVGSTGNTTGPHLHLEVRPGAGDPVDPAAALTAHGVTP